MKDEMKIIKLEKQISTLYDTYLLYKHLLIAYQPLS